MEESKEPTQKQSTTNQYDSSTQERQHKARINNNTNFILAQDEVFRNISSTDRMIAYSLNQNCQSFSRTQHQQILSLLSQFKQTNIDKEHYLGRKKFLKIVKSRLEESKLVDQNLEDEEEEQEPEEQYYDEEDAEEEEDEQQQNENEPQNEVQQEAQMQIDQIEEPRVVIRSQSSDSDVDGLNQFLSASEGEDEEL